MVEDAYVKQEGILREEESWYMQGSLYVYQYKMQSS